MMRFISTALVLSFCFYAPFSQTVYAGFEWVPPVAAPSSQAPSAEGFSAGSSSGFPAPDVFAQPLPDRSVVSEPLSIVPPSISPVRKTAPKKIVRAPVVKNLSGKKLVIDPYPLRDDTKPTTRPVSIIDTYKAMNEASGNLHPVKLGNGLTTGAKKIGSIPKATKTASTTHQKFSVSKSGSGLTPIIGVEPPPLPGTAYLRGPVEKTAPAVNYTEAVGFGRDLPLALALSQVVPAGFTHSFAKNVDAGKNVSWEGGKPWNEVLNDMLRPQNLTSIIQGNQVIIQKLARL